MLTGDFRLVVNRLVRVRRKSTERRSKSFKTIGAPDDCGNGTTVKRFSERVSGHVGLVLNRETAVRETGKWFSKNKIKNVPCLRRKQIWPTALSHCEFWRWVLWVKPGAARREELRPQRVRSRQQHRPRLQVRRWIQRYRVSEPQLRL